MKPPNPKKIENEEEIIFACKFCDKAFNDSGTLKFHETCRAHNDYQDQKSIKTLKTKTDESFSCKICPVKFKHKHEAASNKTIKKDAEFTESQVTEIVEEETVDLDKTTKSKKSENEEEIILACKCQ